MGEIGKIVEMGKKKPLLPLLSLPPLLPLPFKMILLDLSTEFPYSQDMNFEWDERKAQANLAKHKIDFGDVLGVFLDPCRLETIDDREDYQETRFKVIGQVDELTLVVIYTERVEKIRLISARRANRRERKAYENHKTSS